MNDKDLDSIKEIAQSHTIEPSDAAWNRLEQKLKYKSSKKRLNTYRNISIAAILISVLSITAVFRMNTNNHDPEIFASNEEYRPIVFEELQSDTEDSFFNSAHISNLNEAYTDAVLSTFKLF